MTVPELIPPPSHVSPIPDEATKSGLGDLTGPTADKRVLRINLGFFKYGASEPAHAAAVVLSMILLFSVIGLTAFVAPTPGVDKLVTFLESGFLITLGVAIGQSPNRNRKTDDDEA